MDIRLIEIGADGQPVEELTLPEVARSVGEASVGVYRKTGFVRPWVGYLAEQDGRVVGTCAFKSPPQEGRVEIAYFTFPEHEGKGVATRMARRLVQIARDADQAVAVFAQTLPQENASTAVLRKLGFTRTETAHDDEVGEVWGWQMTETYKPPLKKPGQGRTIAVVGDVYRFLATGDDTNGKYALWEAVVPPGGGPPPHVHSREEGGLLRPRRRDHVHGQRGAGRRIGGHLRQHAGWHAALLQERGRPPGEDADLGRPCRAGADVLRGRRAAGRGSDDGLAANER